MTEDPRTPGDVLRDLLVYAPLGFAFEARRLLPELADRGRDQVAAARVIGELVVQRAGSQLGSDVERLGRDVSRAVGVILNGMGLSPPEVCHPRGDEPTRSEPGRSGAEAPPPPDGTTTGAPRAPGATTAPTPPTAPTAPAADAAAGAPADAAARPDAADLAIPGYDSLAASQVVPRLTSLDVAELEAVKAYEAAKRGRRTILNRIEQLLEQRRGGA